MDATGSLQRTKLANGVRTPRPDFNQLLPVTSPGDQEHEAGCPNQVSEEEHPGPNGQVVHAVVV